MYCTLISLSSSLLTGGEMYFTNIMGKRRFWREITRVSDEFSQRPWCLQLLSSLRLMYSNVFWLFTHVTHASVLWFSNGNTEIPLYKVYIGLCAVYLISCCFHTSWMEAPFRTHELSDFSWEADGECWFLLVWVLWSWKPVVDGLSLLHRAALTEWGEK